MTKDETGRLFVYDAWNRLVTVKNSGGTTLESFGYDGMNRRVTQTASGTTTDLFYSDQGQVLEEKVGSNTNARYVWSPVYVNAMILRDRSTLSNGTLDERLWVQQDANWNVTALVNGSGAVVERYAYDSFGAQTVYDVNYTVRGGGSSYASVYGFQGMRYDAVSGLNAADMRWYSSTLGRWVSNDPIGFQARDTNLYRSVFNNPLNHTDPSGQIVPLIIGLFVLGAGTAGGIAGYSSGEGSSGFGSWMPGYGEGRNAGAALSKGEYWSAGGHAFLAGTDVFLVRSVAKNAGQAYAVEGWRAFLPGYMAVYSDRKACHYSWSTVSVTGDRAYQQALRDTTVTNGGLIIKASKRAGLALDPKLLFRFPTFSTGMAGTGRVGYPAWKCVTAPFTAASAGTYHTLPYAGYHYFVSPEFDTSDGVGKQPGMAWTGAENPDGAAGRKGKWFPPALLEDID